MDFFARQGADPQPYGVYGKGLQLVSTLTWFIAGIGYVRSTRAEGRCHVTTVNKK